MQGQRIDRSEIEALRRQYGLDLPPTQQYLKWMSGVVRGDFGRSLQRGRPVSELIRERLPLTLVVNLSTLLFTYVVAIAIGIYSATRQYSIADYVFTFVGFIGMCVPQFLLALILMVLLHSFFGISVGGLFSPEYAMAPWGWGKVVDLLIHLPIPIIVIGMAGTASIIRVLRGSLLDELRKQYVITARTKGISERKLLFKYPVRVAVNPVISTISWVLPSIVSGGAIVAIVLSLPTLGPLLFAALLSQDMYVAGAILLLLSFLTIVGTFVSDLLLVWLDPRIKRPVGRRMRFWSRQDPAETALTAEERYYVATQWQLMWRRLKKHKLAMAGMMVLAVAYCSSLFAEFVAIEDVYKRHISYMYCPAQRIHIVDDGELQWRPFVYGIKVARDPVTLERHYYEEKTARYPVRFFVKSEPYSMWGDCSHARPACSGLMSQGSSSPSAPTSSGVTSSRAPCTPHASRFPSVLSALPSVSSSVVCWEAYQAITVGPSTPSFNASSSSCCPYRPYRCGWHWRPPSRPSGHPCAPISRSRSSSPSSAGAGWRAWFEVVSSVCAKRII